MNKKKRFEKICKDIKTLKVQGAESVAIAGLKAYSLLPEEKSIKKLLSLRATEPALRNALQYAKKFSVAAALKHFKDSEQKTDKLIPKIIKQNSVIFTHCHSSTVVDGLIYAKKHGKKFEVFNTETRPLFQGRKTAKELARAGIKVTTIIEAGARAAIVKDSLLKEANLVLLGADAILEDGSVINKIGSGMFAEIAFNHKVPVYIATDAWKFSQRKIKIEERNFKEIWKNAPAHVRIKNPAFEIVEAKYIKAIISELGILKPEDFVRKIKKVYDIFK
jgi:ribose 1,5-bisphosphate isomerase